MNVYRREITTPLTEEKVKQLKAGDFVYITGTVYTARDAAHQRLIGAIQRGEELPFEPQNQIIYYTGPTPTRPGHVIGSAGPTSSYRMDEMTIPLLKLGLKGMIGKGVRSQAVIEGIKNYKAVYFAAIGGAGALISECIKQSETIAYMDLGTEAVRKLKIERLPVIVAIDCCGGSLYEKEIQYKCNEN
ncbi:MAG: Fe-S-containing hydro-lyase [Peptococcaceae bacterium]|nr:Fe-S-containing hydro-lyase [Peptococcaceae bacterium]